jgi:hypothetical protein
MTDDHRPESALNGLLMASVHLHPDDLPPLVAREARKLGAADALIYLVELEQRSLVHLVGQGQTSRGLLAVDGTPAGDAFRTERPVVDADAGTLWVPLLDSAERVGVLGITGAPGADLSDADLIARCEAFASLAAEIIVNKSAYGDAITRARRTRPVTIAAEIRWTMLPPLTYSGRNVTISGLVEPAYEIAGDTFDYALNGDLVQLAIIDGVGHGLEAGRIANLAVGAYRHSRRGGLDTIETYRAMDIALAQEFGPEKFATAQLAELDINTGRLRWLNAGHPTPMLVRNNEATDMASEVCLPLGLGLGSGLTEANTAEMTLEPGDAVLFFTDGVVEARATDGLEFGRDRLARLLLRAWAEQELAPETMRLLGLAVLDHQDGVLQDDATLLLLVWRGPAAPMH